METKYIYELRSMIYLNNGNGFTPLPLPKQAQLSTIEDIFINNNDIIYTGNYYGFVTELGESSSNPGGVLTNFENNTYQKSIPLNLPKDFSGRKIVKLKEDSFLVLSNNGKSYILNPKF
jgi:hypothetical protein